MKSKPVKRPRKQDFPLLRGTLVQGRKCLLIYVWCPFCRTHHIHGWKPGNVKPEHRVAHCTSAEVSPMHAKGYLIAPWRKSDPENQKNPTH